jgi:hypothetical protein
MCKWFDSPLGHMGLKFLETQAPGFGGCLRARPRHRARAPLDPRGQCAHAHAQVRSIGVLAQVRGCCDIPQKASVVDALASFGVVHADMPLTLANIWLAIQGPACSEGPARQCFP